MNPGSPFVKITRYPPGMTGSKLRKQLGLPERIYSPVSFALAREFSVIKAGDRLEFLRKQAQAEGIGISWSELRGARAGFDRAKGRVFPMAEDCACYVCGKQAAIRHHVKPLGRGGRNKRNNIVPLCAGCHAEIHPHLKASMAR